MGLANVARDDKWFCIFSAYWLASVVWADLPFVGFKRWIKGADNLVMLLVIPDRGDPLEAVEAGSRGPFAVKTNKRSKTEIVFTRKELT